MKTIAFVLLLSLAIVNAEVLYSENFGAGWEDRWVQSTHKSDYGKWEVTAGKYFQDEVEDAGLQTSQDARNYAISADMNKEFSNEGKDLVVQFSVKHEQNIDCGGGYIKVLPSGLDQKKFNGDSEYNIMFGPDICGAAKKIHLIFNYNGKNLLWKKEPRCESDTYTHLYTMILHADNTYEVRVDNKKVEGGNLADDWDFLEPKMIKDPSKSKPADWVDEKEIADPEDKKPENWDDQPATIPDPDAKKPDDWDDEDDGEWEAPLIDNPEFKGEWKPKMIPNPEYKGEWVHPEIENPDYKEDSNLYLFESNKFVGFDLWQVKAGTIFDNILISDSVKDAEAVAEGILARAQAEKDAEEKVKAEEAKKAEEAAKAAEPEKTEDAAADENRDEKLNELKDEL
eukprot:TRINITY_DN1154_c0_g2_i1.p1 TRINITY_DN1154_c0_g2~~TRINITY_DN1154_c0_g2_i1.p1  ORF type:complete len:398 (+),score=168.37 TRINITY_DN1154_c0_g2_i1:112-1305(+)